ncbi:MAG: SDR family NAD(P)-dependent oxidoreductase [Bacteroidetes bacterium]|nr:SDR family NAD(P)-dependent oxidoreductase [Bacteroidota bacterium]
MKQLKILVTGGAGFIGSNLCDSLLDEGHEIICLDNFDDFYSTEIKQSNISQALLSKKFTFIKGDIRDKKLIDEIFSTFNPELIIHLAAKAGVRPSIQNPELYFDVNVNGTICLLEAMKKFELKKMIFASSSSVYGNSENVPFSETENVDHPISPYAASKKAGELICHTYHHLFGLDICCLRFFTVYGPRQRPEMAIHYFTHQINNHKPINVFGDGTTKRDYTYIQDIIKGIKGAMENCNGFEIVNLGESSTISLTKLIELIEIKTGKKAILNKLAAQPGDVDITFADIAKAKRILGYDPSFPIEKGIEIFVDWYNKTNTL